MGRRDALRAHASGNLAEGGIAGTPCLRLESFPGRRPLDRDALEVEGNAEVGAEAADKGRVGVALGTEAVVDVDGVQRHAKLGGEGAEHVEEGDRVAAARQGDQDNFAAPGHPGAANGVEDERAEVSACGHIRLGGRPRLLRPRSTPSSTLAPSL